MSSSRATPNTNSRPVHPCYLSVWEGGSGAEYSTWAHISSSSSSSSSGRPYDRLPNLITAQASTLNCYSIEETTGKLILQHTFPNLAGSVCYLETLRAEGEPDSLLVGFAGHPRLTVVSIQKAPPSSLSSSPIILLATSLLDLTPALTEHSFGAATPLEQDLVASASQKKNFVTVSIILGGGVAVACVELHHSKPSLSLGGGGGGSGGGGTGGGGTSTGGWIAREPYILPLHTLSRSLKLGDVSKDGITNTSSTASSSKDLIQSIATGFGDILSTTFLPGYLEPTIVLLHANHAGRTWPGRLGRLNGMGGTRYGLVATAISVTVTHQRSAVLWSVEVPSDALEVYAVGNDTCLVLCTNSIISIGTSGQVRQCLAMNGWVQSTLTPKLLDVVQPNPWPFPKLAIQLDGARLSPMNDKAALLALRGGQLYLLQHSNSWCMLPLHQTVGASGQVANLRCWPFGEVPKALANTLWDKNKPIRRKEDENNDSIEMGLIFVGSRLGDSSLLGYGLESTSVADAIKREEALRQAPTKVDENGGEKGRENALDYDTILRLEEEALYAPVDNGSSPSSQVPHVIPPSSDEEDHEEFVEVKGGGQHSRKRARMSQLVVVRSLTALDSLTALGPLGPGCEGPVAPSPHMLSSSTSEEDLPIGASGYVFPCGYGSSGGLALLMAPGRDGRSVIAEEDCINTQCIFSFPSRGMVLLGMSPEDGGSRFLQLERTSDDSAVKVEDMGGAEQNESHTLAEVDMDEWCMSGSTNPKKLLATSTLLGAVELDSENFLLLVSSKLDETTTIFSLVALMETNGRLQIKFESELPLAEGISIRTLTRFVRQSRRVTAVACTLSSGNAMLVTVDSSGTVSTFDLHATTPMDVEEDDQNDEASYYRSGAIVALDLFRAPKAFFSPRHDADPSQSAVGDTTEQPIESNKAENADLLFDEDDLELYGGDADGSDEQASTPKPIVADTQPEGEAIYLAVCRQSGDLEVYSTAELSSGHDATYLWRSEGCGQGVGRLEPSKPEGSHRRIPRMHRVHTTEMRFFFCGPSSTEWDSRISSPRPFLLAIETNAGDTLLYSAEIVPTSSHSICFSRVALKVVTRPSQEQSRHFAKLRRKRIVEENSDLESSIGFRHIRLHPFHNVSGQDGLFAAVARPMWIVAERGKPTVLYHRSRHVAPSGAKPRPVAGFCSGILVRMREVMFAQPIVYLI